MTAGSGLQVVRCRGQQTRAPHSSGLQPRSRVCRIDLVVLNREGKSGGWDGSLQVQQLRALLAGPLAQPLRWWSRHLDCHLEYACSGVITPSARAPAGPGSVPHPARSLVAPPHADGAHLRAC